MLTFSGSLKVFVAVEPCDMRRSFNGLHNAVVNQLREEPKSGAIFAFIVSVIFTGLRPSFAKPRPVPHCGRLFGQPKAG